MSLRALLVTLLTALAVVVPARAQSDGVSVPRPEHPRPDAARSRWVNLNGPWQFRFDPKDEGQKGGWSAPDASGFEQTITVPFPWESVLSGVNKPDYKGVAWYRRSFRVPAEFPKGQHVWLRFGAVDWQADVWVNGRHVAAHEGGYSPFEVDVTDALKPDAENVMTVRVDDPTDPSLPTGKQVGWYTHTSGIWQTVWIEARPRAYVASFAVKTTLDPAAAHYEVQLDGLPRGKSTLTIRAKDDAVKAVATTVERASLDTSQTARLTVPVNLPRYWSPEDPYLYDVTLELKTPDGQADAVQSYFGLRTIARGTYGNALYERLLLNGKPIYLRAALDQSFNPKGVYTAPDDEFLKRDILTAKAFGLNGLRIHIKPDEPRRLYWADKLGMLILEDMPNTWDQNARARRAWEATMREVVARDKNHPSIVAWVAFNETWGLGTPPEYKANTDTQRWVSAMVDAVRKLDPTRLVEDNSPCNYDHVANTDLNSWHFYIDDHEGAKRHIADVVAQTQPGSGFNYCPGQKQATAPLINSEYGGVSAGGGDRDVSWCFRDLTTLLRRQPKIQGYVYTELADIEWEHNGFVNYDRAPKEFGYDAFLPGMQPSELNGPDFVGCDAPPAIVAKPGETLNVPVFVSHFSDHEGPITLRWWVAGFDDRADLIMASIPQSRPAEWTQYDVRDLGTVSFKAPDRPFVGALMVTIRDEANRRITGNFVNVVVKPDKPLPRVQRRRDHEVLLRFAPGDFARQHWDEPGSPPPGKAYGRGKGYLEYRLKVPEAVAKAKPESYFFRFEIASKAGREKVDWASRKSPQDYPQTDARKWPSTVAISINGHEVDRQKLDDDPADARGVLSHVAGVEHGSYGELVEGEGPLPQAAKDAIAAGKPLVVRLAVPDDAAEAGGLCLFGADTGQYPFDPTIAITTGQSLPKDLGVPPDQAAAVETLVSRRVQLLSAGDSQAAPSMWSYTTVKPGEGWTDTGFDDKGWKRGPAGFGAHNTPGVRVRTEWTAPEIWLRTEVEIPALTEDTLLTLHFFHDEDVALFVNGHPLLKAAGYITAYRDVVLDKAQKTLFQKGRNVIAVHCRQTSGGQGVDVGLTLQAE
ncbi:MAG: glycoside hydrolase family 2 TIM barrel-domain containing protein [Isosphaeraceae bacterium]|nr:glycoside hydrolase family 2 TIM barrel-domain containing protein [Isosphaeraceae bacterium]